MLRQENYCALAARKDARTSGNARKKLRNAVLCAIIVLTNAAENCNVYTKIHKWYLYQPCRNAKHVPMVNPFTGNSCHMEERDSPNYKNKIYLVKCYDILFAGFRATLLIIKKKILKVADAR